MNLELCAAMSSEPPRKKPRVDATKSTKSTKSSRTLAVLGLGNPGRKTERHSLGARVAAAVARDGVAVEVKNKDSFRKVKQYKTKHTMGIFCTSFLHRKQFDFFDI